METSLTLTALDGRPLAATLCGAPAPAARGLVVFGALGVPRAYYRAFGRWMAEHGVPVLTFDYRGCAGSASMPSREDPAVLLDWAQLDASAAVDLALTRWSEVWALGHSFGGQAFGLTPRSLDLAGAFVVAAGTGDLTQYPPELRRKYGLVLGVAAPLAASVLGYVQGRLGLGEDLPGGVVGQWSRWCRTPGYAQAALGRDQTWYHRIDAPMHFVEVSDDTYAPHSAAAALRAQYERAAVTHRMYTPAELGRARIGHFGMFRPGFDRIWTELLRVMAPEAALSDAEAARMAG